MNEPLDRRFMAAAIAIAERGLGRTSPNPSVGAVVVADAQRIVGLARTADGGRPHAEPLALQMAGPAARGATLYVTLEPCSHVGRSPPCVDAVIDAGIRRVVVAVRDPNPLVGGGGLARLRAAGMAITEGVRAEEASRQLSGHLKAMTAGRAHVTLKLALSREGAIGRRGAGQIALSDRLSRNAVHVMRAASDAVAVGVGTVIADDPLLTVRLPGMAQRSPRRIVFDTAARTPPNAAILTGDGPPVTIFVGEGADDRTVRQLTETGATVVPTVMSSGRLDLSVVLAALADDGVRNILVEGGAEIAEALFGQDLIDGAVVLQTPRSIDTDPIAPFGGRAMAVLSDRLTPYHRRRFGDDVWIRFERRSSAVAIGMADAASLTLA